MRVIFVPHAKARRVFYRFLFADEDHQATDVRETQTDRDLTWVAHRDRTLCVFCVCRKTTLSLYGDIPQW